MDCKMIKLQQIWEAKDTCEACLAILKFGHGSFCGKHYNAFKDALYESKTVPAEEWVDCTEECQVDAVDGRNIYHGGGVMGRYVTLSGFKEGYRLVKDVDSYTGKAVLRVERRK